MGFSVAVALYCYIVEYAFVVWSEDKLNKKLVVAKNFAELVSTVCFNMPGSEGLDPLFRL